MGIVLLLKRLINYFVSLRAALVIKAAKQSLVRKNNKKIIEKSQLTNLILLEAI